MSRVRLKYPLLQIRCQFAQLAGQRRDLLAAIVREAEVRLLLISPDDQYIDTFSSIKRLFSASSAPASALAVASDVSVVASRAERSLSAS
jgi:hypothetical protein